MEKFNRAVRRHHRDRLKAKRKSYWGGILSDEAEARLLGFVARTPAVCSCWMCGHERRIYGRTIQERRLFQDLDYAPDEPTDGTE